MLETKGTSEQSGFIVFLRLNLLSITWFKNKINYPKVFIQKSSSAYSVPVPILIVTVTSFLCIFLGSLCTFIFIHL